MSERRKRRVHIFIFEEDWHALNLIYGDNLTASGAIREIISAAVASLRAKIADKSSSIKVTPDDLSSVASKLGLSTDQPPNPQ